MHADDLKNDGLNRASLPLRVAQQWHTDLLRESQQDLWIAGGVVGHWVSPKKPSPGKPCGTAC